MQQFYAEQKIRLVCVWGLTFGLFHLFVVTSLAQSSIPNAAQPCQNQGSVTITEGTPDQFAGQQEPTFQGEGILSLGSGPWAPFDFTKADRQFGHTMRNLPCNISGALLTLALKSNSNLSSNDTIGLGITGETPRFLWARKIKDLLGQPWNQAGATGTLNLNLAALPKANGGTVNILDLVNSSGALDIYIQDDTAVDYMTLNAQTCVNQDCNNNGIEDDCEANPITMRCPGTISKTLPAKTDSCCLEFTLTPFASNLCGKTNGITITNDYNSAIGAFTDCFPVGTTTITFTATDQRGNTANCTTTVTVVDDTPPTILFCPEL